MAVIPAVVQRRSQYARASPPALLGAVAWAIDRLD
jgi:hypothetical protein